MSILPDIFVHLRAFAHDERGAAGIEFIMTLPLLIGALVLTAEYGKALRYRMILTAATADVTSFLSRAPLAGDSADLTTVAFYEEFTEQAESMIEARMGGEVQLTASVFQEPREFALRSETVSIVVRTDICLNIALLGFINSIWNGPGNAARSFCDASTTAEDGPAEELPTVIPMSAQVQTKWLYDASQIGQADCSNVERAQDLCGTSSDADAGST
ncbi:MAG: TadE/TadG family type IV pilus assembly protein [Paracoccaceae bacterium]